MIRRALRKHIWSKQAGQWSRFLLARRYHAAKKISFILFFDSITAEGYNDDIRKKEHF